MHNLQYIGDGVYTHVDDSRSLILTTGHHEPDQADNTIVLEPSIIKSLENYIKSSREQNLLP
jgi:hypothetical protein